MGRRRKPEKPMTMLEEFERSERVWLWSLFGILVLMWLLWWAATEFTLT
jgi:hypothetical protein